MRFKKPREPPRFTNYLLYYLIIGGEYIELVCMANYLAG